MTLTTLASLITHNPSNANNPQLAATATHNPTNANPDITKVSVCYISNQVVAEFGAFTGQYEGIEGRGRGESIDQINGGNRGAR
jgi:hypothetical protein